jgi:hypothetical protein
MEPIIKKYDTSLAKHILKANVLERLNYFAREVIHARNGARIAF